MKSSSSAKKRAASCEEILKSLMGTCGFMGVASFDCGGTTRGRFAGNRFWVGAATAFRLRVRRSGAEKGRCDGRRAERSMVGAVTGINLRITFLGGLKEDARALFLDGA
jgi:hypothetical protein